MFFGRTAQNPNLGKKQKIRVEDRKNLSTIFATKKWENGLIHGIINFIHNFGDKNAESVDGKKNKRFVSF